MGYQRRVHGAHSVNYCLTIMKTILVLACVALAGAKHIHVKIDQLEYGFCDGSAEPASIDAASVEPFPIVVATGETITLSVQITLNEVVPAGAQVSLKIKKEGLIPVPIPCLEIDGLHIGSCDYDGDHLLELGAETLCPLVLCLRYQASLVTSWHLALTMLMPLSPLLMGHRWLACMSG